jgi:hypothetical protein
MFHIHYSSLNICFTFVASMVMLSIVVSFFPYNAGWFPTDLSIPESLGVRYYLSYSVSTTV